MKSLKRQGGFLVETVIGLVLFLGVVAAFIIPMQLEKQRDEAAESYAKDIRYLITRIHQYQHHKVTVEGERAAEAKSWPASLSALVTDYPGRFWNECTITAENNGECRRPDSVPWSNSRILTATNINYAAAPYNTHFLLFIPTSQIADAKEWMRWTKPLMKIPGAEMIMGDVQITLRQATLALMFEDIVMRNGEATLTATWDVGNQKITNVKDLNIRTADGTQTSVAKGMVSTYRLSPGESFRKPKCPSGLTPDPVLAIGNLDVEQPYTLVGSVKPYISGETSTHWTVNIEMMVINNTTGSYEKVRKGEIVALAQCK